MPVTVELLHADEAEDALAGALVLAPDLLAKVREVVEPRDFRSAEPREVFESICALADAGEPVDAVTVADRYSATYKRNGHAKLAVADLAQGCPVPRNAVRYAERVRDAAQRRRGIELANSIISDFATDKPGEVADYASLAFRELATARDAASWYASGDALRAEPPPAPPGVAWFVTETGEAVLRSGLRYLVVGEAGVGKSLLALSACIEVAAAGRDAVFLDAEGDVTTFVRRLHALAPGPRAVRLASQPTLADRLHYRSLDGDETGLPLPQGTALVVLDGLGAALAREQLDENSASDVLRFLARVIEPLRLKAPDAAVILLDHPGHADSTRGRGSSAKRPAVDCELGLKSTGRDHASLILRKDRHATSGVPVGRAVAEVRRHVEDDGTLAVELREPEHTTDDAGHFRPTVLMERVADELARRPEGMTMREVEDAVTGKRDYIRAAIAALVREECVREARGARGARLLTFERHPATSPQSSGRGHEQDGGELR